MKGAAIVALALVAGGLLAHLLLIDPGYVAVRLGRTLFETTLPIFALLLAGGYFLVRALVGAASARARLAQLRAERRKRRAREETQRGLLDLAAGNWKSAEELLSRSAPDSDSPAANYLVAARAADLLDAVDRRDEWLARAQEDAPGERAAALVTLAEMQMRRGQDEPALQTLEQLDASGDLNSRGLELMARLYQKLGRGRRTARARPAAAQRQGAARGAGERASCPCATRGDSRRRRARRQGPARKGVVGPSARRAQVATVDHQPTRGRPWRARIIRRPRRSSAN